MIKNATETANRNQKPDPAQDPFCRNIGILTAHEQEKLRGTRVAIAGMGGVGGGHAIALARLGIGKFTIADPDQFEIANLNRQYGALRSTLNQPKVDVMKRMILDVNPEADVQIFQEKIDASNIDAFLDGSDLVVDGIDAFEIDARRLLFKKAAQKGLYTVSAGPVGIGCILLVFDPHGMGFDEYFDIHDGMDNVQKFAAFLSGVAPKATHRSYLDFSKVNVSRRQAPSVGLACFLASGVLAAEALKIVLRRGTLRCVPHYFQFDAYKQVYVKGHLWLGNRNPIQKIKRRLLERFLCRQK